jgi:hypothetical protein
MTRKPLVVALAVFGGRSGILGILGGEYCVQVERSGRERSCLCIWGGAQCITLGVGSERWLIKWAPEEKFRGRQMGKVEAKRANGNMLLFVLMYIGGLFRCCPRYGVG